MKRFTLLALASLMVLPAAVMAQAASSAAPKAANAAAVAVKASGVRAAAGEVEVSVKVVELDVVARTASLQTQKGKVIAVVVPDTVKNLEQVRVGDVVKVRYMAAVAAALEPASNNGIREQVESATKATAAVGNTPGVAGRRTVEVLATVQAIDRKAGTATLRGVRRTETVAIPEGMDISKIKVGDAVRAKFVEAAVLSVEPVVAPAAKK